MLSPNLNLTVPRDLWDALAIETSGAFADSYLSGAELYDSKLLPWTHIGWTRLRDSKAAMWVFRQKGVTLVEPPYFTDKRQAETRG